MNTTFKEKSLFVQLFALIAAYTVYGYNVMPEGAVSSNEGVIGQFIIFILTLIVINIIGHIVTSVVSAPEADDERDKLIMLKSSNFKAMLLSSGIVLSVLLSLRLDNVFWTIQALLGLLVASEIVAILAQLIYYRRGF